MKNIVFVLALSLTFLNQTRAGDRSPDWGLENSDMEIQGRRHLIDPKEEGDPDLQRKRSQNSQYHSHQMSQQNRQPASSGQQKPFRIIDLPAPDYPATCLDRGIEGTVLLKIKLGPKGSIQNVSVVKFPKECPEFVSATREALKRARFHPLPVGRHISDQSLLLPVNFEMAR